MWKKKLIVLWPFEEPVLKTQVTGCKVNQNDFFWIEDRILNGTIIRGLIQWLVTFLYIDRLFLWAPSHWYLKWFLTLIYSWSQKVENLPEFSGETWKKQRWNQIFRAASRLVIDFYQFKGLFVGLFIYLFIFTQFGFVSVMMCDICISPFIASILCATGE